MNLIERKIKKPILRWAGGKQWLTRNINEFIPRQYNNYFEPFLGGGAIFLFLNPKETCVLSDKNEELINFYCQVKDNIDKLIKELNFYVDKEDLYYATRNKTLHDDIKRAARFLFLNKTGFNGIYRVNQKGIYNVPYGHRNLTEIFNKVELFELHYKLQGKTILKTCDFENSLKKVRKNDFVFLDPPYTVAHNNNGFIEYNKTIFSWSDQERLRECVFEINKKKAFFILTNAVHDSIFSLYKDLGKKFEIERYSTISGHMKNRKKVSELLITNCI